eukprot:CAMPEP_0181331844 /NCGR_PEP_ID=MMETSP1101-20121128/24746_1 /TAXON_ID=46948 /ORGANISM="Rhodomonas abbreviata, Strain Caron Lab Isolate" /LENGTH=130 /DNA_ID=CAMNT_0023441387 /DNA_START=27 /DNA_END=415 /DNA_ORIENTATION=+
MSSLQGSHGAARLRGIACGILLLSLCLSIFLVHEDSQPAHSPTTAWRDVWPIRLLASVAEAQPAAVQQHGSTSKRLQFDVHDTELPRGTQLSQGKNGRDFTAESFWKARLVDFKAPATKSGSPLSSAGPG